MKNPKGYTYNKPLFSERKFDKVVTRKPPVQTSKMREENIISSIPPKRIDFDYYFMALAKLAAVRSGCNSRPTGAVIVKNRRVIATGYNGTISGHPQCSDKGPDYCYRRSTAVNDKGDSKYQACPGIHAEQNAINQVALCGGTSLHNADIYTTLYPCLFCMKNIVSVGIKRIFYELDYFSDDGERDQVWLETSKTYDVEIIRIKIPSLEKSYMCKLINTITSSRRL